MKNTLFTCCSKNIARNGIDLSKVTGTGKEGRITRKDLLSLIESNDAQKIKLKQVSSTDHQVRIKRTKEK